MYFYALPEELTERLGEIEARRPLRYYLWKYMREPTPVSYSSVLEIRKFGIEKADQFISTRWYIIMDAGSEYHPNTMELRNGTVLYGPKTELNPGSIRFRTCEFNKDVLFAGELINVHSDSAAVTLETEFKRVIKKDSVKIDCWWVTPLALAYLQQGGKLTSQTVESTEGDWLREAYRKRFQLRRRRPSKQR